MTITSPFTLMGTIMAMGRPNRCKPRRRVLRLQQPVAARTFGDTALHADALSTDLRREESELVHKTIEPGPGK
jgi:hypothetical protein